MSAPGSGDLIIIGGTFSDAHVVSIYLACALLQENGYEVVNLSCCNRTADFFAAIPVEQVPLAIVIVNQNGAALADLQDLPALRASYNVDTPIFLGGHYHVGIGPTDEIDRQLRLLGVSHIVNTQEQLLECLKQLADSRCVDGDGPLDTYERAIATARR